MRKIALIIVSVMMMVLLMGCASETSIEDVFQGKSKQTEQDVALQLGETNKKEEHEFVFKEFTGNEIPHTKNCSYVYMYLDDTYYYPIEVPMDLEYVTDNSKYIYAKDGTLSVSVVSCIDRDHFSSEVFVEDAETIKQNVVASKDREKEKLEAAAFLINDKAVIVRSFNCEDVFNVVLKGLENNSVMITEYKTLRYDKMQQTVPAYSGYLMSVSAGLGDDIQKIYTFDDGSLTINKELRKFETAVDNLSLRLSVVTGMDKASYFFQNSNMSYIEIGEYVAAVYKVNYNTSLTCFGYGEEAKYNTVAFLFNQVFKE